MILEGTVEIYGLTLYILLTMDKIWLICSLNVNFKSKTNPKYFWAEQRFKGLLLTAIDGQGTAFNFLWKIASWAGLDGSGLKLMFQLKSHSVIFAKSLLNSEEIIVTSWTADKKDMLSENSLQFDDKPSGKSLI